MSDEKMDELIDEIRKLRIRTQRVNVNLDIIASGIWGLARAYALANDIGIEALDYDMTEYRDTDDDA